MSRLAARSVASLCAGAPACHEAMRLGAGALVREVAQDPLLADELLRISRAAPPPGVVDVDRPFEPRMTLMLNDLGDVGIDEVIAFGAGVNGQLFAQHARLAQVRIRCFVDNDTTRRRTAIDGTPVVSLDQARSIPCLPFVVCTMAGCQDVVRQLAPIQESDARMVFTHLNSWRWRLEHDGALRAADALCRGVIRDAVQEKAPWATAYLLCNYRRLVHEWAAAAIEKPAAHGVSPFVYQMQ